MLDPLHTLAERFSAALVAAFGDEVADADPMVRVSDRADFQANAAMGLAKRLKKAPRQIAEAIVKELKVDDLATEVTIAGPGFINVTLTTGFLGERVSAQLADARVGVPSAEAPETVVIDYSAPNVAKEMHVGHLRSTVIGDAVARVLEFQGHEVYR